MELQFGKTSCRCLTSITGEVKNEELTQELKLSDGMPDIGRVLTCWGQVVVRSKEWRSGTASVSGGVMVWVLYAPEDGSDARSVDTWIPFTIKWDVPEAEREGIIQMKPLLRFADSRALSARKMMVRAGVAAMGDILYPTDIEVFHAEEVPEDVELLKKTYPVRLPMEAGEKAFLLDEDLAVPNPAPEKILSYTVQPEITEKKIMAGKGVFRGNGNLHLIYRCSDGQLRTWDYELPFSQLQEFEGNFDGESQINATIAVTSLELDMNEERLRVKCGLVCQYVVDGSCVLELTEDAYSPSRPVEIAMEELFLPAVLDDRSEAVAAQQSIMGHQGQVVDVTFLPDFPRQRRVGEEISFELSGLFQVLFYADDGTIQCASSRWDGEVRLGAGENSHVHGLIAPIGYPSAGNTADGMELRGQMMLQMQTTSEQGLPMVTALDLGEMQDPDPNRPSLILCRNSGSLWDLAKRCGSTVDMIRCANGLETEPDPERILLIPIQ